MQNLMCRKQKLEGHITITRMREMSSAYGSS